jgi:hypothetical protein
MPAMRAAAARNAIVGPPPLSLASAALVAPVDSADDTAAGSDVGGDCSAEIESVDARVDASPAGLLAPADEGLADRRGFFPAARLGDWPGEPVVLGLAVLERAGEPVVLGFALLERALLDAVRVRVAAGRLATGQIVPCLILGGRARAPAVWKTHPSVEPGLGLRAPGPALL